MTARSLSPPRDDDLVKPIGPPFFAGEYTAGEWHGLMEGALRSGQRAAVWGRRGSVTLTTMGIHHVDLAVAEVERSLAFYLGLLGPLGWEEAVRYPTYRGTEEVVYLEDRATGSMLGIRPADGGSYRYYEVGIEHIAFEVESRDEVDEAHTWCRSSGARIHFPPEEDRDVPGYYAFFAFDPDGFRVEVFCWDRRKTALEAPELLPLSSR